jgi:hypothetical protein
LELARNVPGPRGERPGHRPRRNELAKQAGERRAKRGNGGLSSARCLGHAARSGSGSGVGAEWPGHSLK